jgi:carboxypeptidase Taq
MNSENDYAKYVKRMQQIADVKYSIAVLNWDQETYLPRKGAEARARQIATLTGMAHDLFVKPELEELLESLNENQNLDEDERANVRETRRDYLREKKYTTEFVIRMAQATSESFNARLQALEENRFEIFLPSLEKMVDLKREETKILGYSKHPYDALTDQFDPGLTVEKLDVLFADAEKQLLPLINNIVSQPKQVNNFLNKVYNKQKQWEFGIYLLKQMNYDFDAGRQDISGHPFTTSFSPHDVRVTTRIVENDFSNMVWSCIHEGGHALYEQGLKNEFYGLPLGEACSFSIHESQSRLWENCVGRSFAYWKANYAYLQKQFPENLSTIGLDSFYKSINAVKPSLIRTEADELTYHFHIFIRYGLEKKLIEKNLEVKDVKEAWNESYLRYLGLTVPDDKRGVLQDVHWSHGGFGYFPTYSIGSFYAAQFFATAQKQIPSLNGEIEKGNLEPLLGWLRKNIYVHGRKFTSEELCERVTGQKLKFSYFMDYARSKFAS